MLKWPVFFVLCIYFGAAVRAEASSATPVLNDLIQSYRSCDLKCLELKFDDFKRKYSKEDKRVLEIVYKVLLAERYLDKLDSRSNRSEQLFLDAIAMAEKLERKDLIIWGKTNLGFYYYRYSELKKALPYFLKTSYLIEQYSANNLLDAGEVLKKNAFFFGAIEDSKKEETYLKRALTQCVEGSKIHTEIVFNLGISFFKQKEFKKAEVYYAQARDLAKQYNYELLYAKSLGELAKIHIKRNEFDKAKSLLLEDIFISKLNHSDRNTMYAQVQLGRIYLQQQVLDSASSVLYEAKDYVSRKLHLASFESEIVELLLEIAIKKEDANAELHFRRSLDSLSEIMDVTDGDAVVERVNLQLHKEQIKSQLRVEKQKLERSSMLQSIWIVASILLFLAIVVIFISYRRKFKKQAISFEKNILKLQSEQIKSDEKLNETTATLSSYQDYLFEKNTQLSKLEKELKKLKNRPTLHLSLKKKNIQELLDSHLMTKENWLQFKAVFIEEQPDYYAFLIDNFPGLTEANLRIILLQKIGLKNLETAQILGVTVEAVKKSKQRLKKRFETNYSEIFQQ